MWQKLVLKVDVQDPKTMTRIMKTAVSLSGVDSISIDRKANKLTVMVIGDGIDAVDFVTKLRMFCHAEIISVGPARNEKKIEPKKEEQKKQEGQMSKDEDQVKKDENAFAELNESDQANIDPYLSVTVAEDESDQANIDPYLSVTVAEDDRNACVLM
ncbi:hypothetical protein BDE02_17G126700 [Populus trichocarpa]|nr:hypothetical protein BDE02_17G126700 [Populus trichocarpa]